MKVKLILLTFLLFSKIIQAQDKKSLDLNLECIAFYNLENLFDTIIDPDTNKILQEDFTPFGSKKFNTEKYLLKLKNLAFVLDTIGKEITIIGVGGVNSGLTALEKIKCGASLVQLYTGMIYKGPNIVRDIKSDLIKIMLKEKIKNINEMVGTAV